MKQLTSQAFQQARSYIDEHGRALDARLFDFYFADGSPRAVLAELAHYQNEDGGFGHGLEPDLRTAASTAVATQQALNVLCAIDAPSSEPLVRRAVEYLLDTFEVENGVWPIVSSAVEDAPHAPWWTYEHSAQNFGGFLVNPRAALIGHLHHYADLVPPNFLESVRRAVMAQVDALPDEMSMHDLFCYLTLAQSANVPAEDQEMLMTKLRRVVAHSVECDSNKWHEYVLMPLDVAPAPDAPLADAVPQDALDAHLDFLIDTQLPDGSWPLPWSWAFVDAAAWAQAAREWKGHLAVGKLQSLRAFGRIEFDRSEMNC